MHIMLRALTLFSLSLGVFAIITTASLMSEAVQVIDAALSQHR
jgi:SNF family Na+-dependent transporter